MTARLLHVSDFHVKRLQSVEPLDALRELTTKVDPTLVVASGDLAHRGRLVELERCAEALRSLERPLLAVPGNHDIPYTLLRLTRPFALWSRVFGDVEPVFRADGLVVVGLNSVRPRRQQSGALSDAQLARVGGQLEEAQEAFKVVVFHHHVASAPWRTNKPPVSRRDIVLQELARAGVDLVLGGHVHQAAIVERREFDVFDERVERGIVLATAPGLGRPRPRRRGEAQGVNVYDVDGSSLTVTTYAWNGNAFIAVGRRTFERG